MKNIDLIKCHKFDFKYNQVNICKYINHNLRVRNMSKLLKITTMLMITSLSQFTLAGYQVALPLETDDGGGLPNGSVSFGDKDNTGTDEGEIPSTNCIFNDENRVVKLNVQDPDRLFEIGDLMFLANEMVISYSSPSNNESPKPGLSKGKEMETTPHATLYEICADDLSIYPIMGPVDEDERPPVDDHTGPDWTPECILNTSSDYAAINTTNDTREFHSTTFGLTNYTPSRWFYVPDNYEFDNPSSYIYFDKSEQTGDPRVTGPNPNYSYSEICRVRKMVL